ncbi:NIPSNAP family protein [Pseudonocardia benzenivorans]|uniref:NIPSNAP family containing protein n=2 Tax=Pseudonocardia TaxID=1847 RepID=F4CL17_PSEUX|nr:NIPSNAP family protein [Pseudonocardia dioxanivorans]AEA24396.1 NIPSNAP family containing protein [Pseudonocardia dioxanivorans CB1190]GJF05629.1 hypothetical protein PSD17_45800 [Pseudonocardia sp. D17]HWJ62880.1 NIPSNAP family protein [Acidimicrobiales bacterium]
MIYEVREYVAVPGRLEAVIDLFTSATVPMLAKHGMELVSAGRTMIGEHSWGELVYTLRFDDLADLERKWNAMLADPEWIAALSAAEAGGPLFATMRRRILDASPVVTA